MSGHISDATKSADCGLTDSDKAAYEESSRSDSGFLSSGNLLLSNEIISEEISTECTQTDSGIIEDQPKQMHLDSGIDSSLLTQFSSIDIKGLNDLGAASQKQTSSSGEQQEAKGLPWQFYCEQDEEGDTHLHNAIIHQEVQFAKQFIRTVPHPRLLDTPNDQAQAPLHLAVATGQFQVVRLLVVAGAKVGVRNLVGDSPLHIAARNNDLFCCAALTDPVQRHERDLLQLSYSPNTLLRPDFEQWNMDGQTCVHVAASEGSVEVLRHLVFHGADINAREGCSGYTALHYAIKRNDERLVKFLLTECTKLNVKAETYGGRSALQQNLPIATSLLEALLNRGVPSPYSSDDDDTTDDEEMYEETESRNVYKQNLMINANA